MDWLQIVTGWAMWKSVGDFPLQLLNYWLVVIILAIFFISMKMESINKAIKNTVSKIVGDGLSSTYIAIVTLVFGALFSVYSAELKYEFQNGFGMIFAMSLFGLTCLYLVLKKNDEAIQKDIKNKELKLDRQINNLKIHLSNMPPKSVLSNISQHVISLNELIYNENVSDDDKVKAILCAIVTLARLWDGYADDEDSDYNVNLMLVLDSIKVKNEISKGEAGDEYKAAINISPFFLYSDNLDSCLDNCDAILFTKRDYSVSTNTQKIPDTGTPCMCLPVSYGADNQSGNRQLNIFGAPVSVVTKKAIYIPDTGEALRKFIVEAQSSHARFSEQFKTSLVKYYEQRRNSIYSIPLVDEQKVVFAVINIYQGHLGGESKMILRSEEHASSFYHLMSPICNMLVQVLKELEASMEPVQEASNEPHQAALSAVAGE